MSSRDEMMRSLETAIVDMPGNPNRPLSEAARQADEAERPVRVMERGAPSMAAPTQGTANPGTLSIAQSIVRFTEEIAKFLEMEGDRRISEARAFHEKTHQFADRVRRLGIGGL